MTRIAANSSETADDATPVNAVAFQRILCAVDGTRSATEAARQATTLAGPDTRLTFIAVADHAGVGPTAMAELSPDHAAQALQAARSSAREAGIAAETGLVEAPDPREAILNAAREHDLLVLGNPPRSSAAGIMLGATASFAVHSSPKPVLFARPPREIEFPQRIVVASDGSRGSIAVVELAVKIASEHGAHATLVNTGRHAPLERDYRIAEEATMLFEGLDVEAIVVTDDTPAHEAIVQVAEREHASLIIMGSRGLAGIAALKSVSERVAHTAPCSVLVVRPHDEEPER